MILIAYDLRDFKEFSKIFIFFYIVTFTFGGAALGIYYFFEDIILIENGVFYIKIINKVIDNGLWIIANKL